LDNSGSKKESVNTKGSVNMKKMIKLTKSEYELMKILWSAERPLAKHEILAASTEYTWQENYLKKMLHMLLNKGAIKPVGKVQVVKNYTRLYLPTLTEDEYHIQQYPIHSLRAVAGLVNNLFEKSDKGEKEDFILELEQIVEDIKGQNK
jgi:predicted transcriptional regulator